MISGTELVAAAQRVMDAAYANRRDSLAQVFEELGFESDAVWLLAQHMVGALPIDPDATPQSLAAIGFISGFAMALELREEIDIPLP